MEMHYKVLQQGAEAILYQGIYLGRKAILKKRFKKKYRHPDLDQHLTRERIKAECRAIVKCKSYGIFTPTIYFVDLDSGLIIMDYFENSITIKDYLINYSFDNNFECLCQEVGTIVAKLHSNNVIHGDLTTSNMLLVNKNGIKDFSDYSQLEIVLIDFGLSQTESSAEDKGVDLYVLERALLSLHQNSNALFAIILNSYKSSYGKGYEDVINKYEDVQARGRKRTMVG